LNQLLSQGSEALVRVGALHQEGDGLFDLENFALLEACGAWLHQAHELESLRKQSEGWLNEIKNDKLEPRFDVESMKEAVSNWGLLDPFAPGAKLDCLDTVGSWLPAEILQRVLIHYIGWEAHYDEWIDKHSQRLAPMGTRLGQPRVPPPQP